MVFVKESGNAAHGLLYTKKPRYYVSEVKIRPPCRLLRHDGENNNNIGKSLLILQ